MQGAWAQQAMVGIDQQSWCVGSSHSKQPVAVFKKCKLECQWARTPQATLLRLCTSPVISACCFGLRSWRQHRGGRHSCHDLGLWQYGPSLAWVHHSTRYPTRPSVVHHVANQAVFDVKLVTKLKQPRSKRCNLDVFIHVPSIQLVPFMNCRCTHSNTKNICHPLGQL